MAAGLRWFARGDLSWRQWGDEHVVHDDTRGSTHLLDDTTAAVLQELAARPDGATTAELFGTGEVAPGEADAAEFTALTATLEALRAAGLAELRLP